MKKEAGSVVFIKNESGTRLALSQTLPSGCVSGYSGTEEVPLKRKGPILLAHGTFSNHRSVRGLAQLLAIHGFDCWTLDFQGHGHSDNPAKEPDFDSMCIEDAAAALDFLKQRYPKQSIVWIGHSGGGLAVLTLLARKPEYASAIKSIVTLASQATHAAKVPKNRFVIQVSNVITRLLGFAPGKYFKLGPENEFGAVMAQWYRWSLSGRWLGSDGFDYFEALSNVNLPTLMLSGTGDTFIAPPAGCRAIFDKLGSDQKHYQECGLESGFLENYNHARLVSSRSAAREIWPAILNWLQTDANGRSSSNVFFRSPES